MIAKWPLGHVVQDCALYEELYLPAAQGEHLNDDPAPMMPESAESTNVPGMQAGVGYAVGDTVGAEVGARVEGDPIGCARLQLRP